MSKTHRKRKEKARTAAPLAPTQLSAAQRLTHVSVGKGRELRPVPPDNGMAFSVELRAILDEKEVGVDHVQIAADLGALNAVLDEYDRMGIEFHVLCVIPDGDASRTETHKQEPRHLSRRLRRVLIGAATASPTTICVVGYHKGDVVGLYVRSNYLRRTPTPQEVRP